MSVGAGEKSHFTEEHFRLLAESATDYAFITFDPENRVTNWSKGAERILGYPEAEALGMSGAVLFVPEDRANQEHEKEMETALREGRAEDERWHVRRNGERFWASGVMTPLRQDGRLVGFAKVMRDLTERKHSEEQLRASEQEFRTLAHLVPDLLWRSDLDGRATWYNRRWLEYTGQTLEEALGAGWLNAIHPEDRETSNERFLNAIRSGTRLRHEHRIRRADGVYRWFLVRAEPIHHDKGRSVEWLGAATDIHEPRLLLEARASELDRTKEALRALTAELLNTREDEQRRIARELHDSIGQSLAIVEMDLVNLSREVPEEAPDIRDRLGRVQHQVAAVSREARNLSRSLHPSALEDLGLAAALRTLVEEFERANGIGIDLHIEDLPRLLPLPVGTCLYRITQEALRNVMKHGGTDPTVSIRVARTNGTLTLTVRDNGPGFDPDAAGEKGGLGIISMQERARLAGGVLELYAAPGAGTTLRVLLPWPGDA